MSFLQTAASTPSGKFLVNFVLKCPEIFSEPMIDHVERRSGPAVVVAAGPSVDKHKGFLKSTGLPTLYVDAAMPLAASLGVRADYVVSCDPGAATVDFYREGVGGVFLHDASCGMELWGRMRPHLSMACYLLGTPIPSMAASAMDRSVLAVNAFGSVGTYAMVVAAHLGYSPILLLGMDFSFPYGRKHYDGFPHSSDHLSSQAIIPSPVDMRGVGASVIWLACAKFCESAAKSCGAKVVVGGMDGILDLPRMPPAMFESLYARKWKMPMHHPQADPLPNGLMSRFADSLATDAVVEYCAFTHPQDCPGLRDAIRSELGEYATYLKGIEDGRPAVAAVAAAHRGTEPVDRGALRGGPAA